MSGHMGMGPPSLDDTFGVLMLAVAAVSCALLVESRRSRPVDRWDVEVSHLLMGVAMAGMFVPDWSFGPAVAWQLVFGAVLVWFGVKSVRRLVLHGAHVPHAAVHALMGFAMVLMYRFPMASSAAGGGTPTTVGRLSPALGLAMAVLFLASAVTTLASRPVAAAATSNGAGAAPPVAPAAPAAGRLAAPESSDAGTRHRLENSSHAVMCVAMAFMLVLML